MVGDLSRKGVLERREDGRTDAGTPDPHERGVVVGVLLASERESGAATGQPD